MIIHANNFTVLAHFTTTRTGHKVSNLNGVIHFAASYYGETKDEIMKAFCQEYPNGVIDKIVRI